MGTVWLEPGDAPDESVLGVFLSDPSQFGRGIGTEAVRLAIDECRRLHPAQRIALRVRRDNTRAIACYEKVGFVTVSSGTKTLPSGEGLPYFLMALPPAQVPGPDSGDCATSA